jgi:hypothetical protein
VSKSLTLPPEGREADVARLQAFLLAAYPGKEVEVSWEPVKSERSSRQNKALFGHAYRVIAKETGLSGKSDLARLHRDFCRAYFGERAVSVLGRVEVVPLRTTTTDENGNRDVINSGEFSAFYADVERKAAEFGIYIPPPDPRWFLDADR